MIIGKSRFAKGTAFFDFSHNKTDEKVNMDETKPFCFCCLY